MMNLNETKLLSLQSVTEKFGKVIVRHIPGGNAVDYVCAYLKATGEDHTELDALRWITHMFGQPLILKENATEPLLPEWKLIRTEELEDLALLRYASRRGIPADIARQHFVEAYVQNRSTGERMYALGFANEDGGYSLSNVFMKSRTGPNAITFKRGSEPKPKSIHLFEDGFDYLSALLRFPQYVTQHDSIILNDGNDVSFGFPYIAGYGYQTLYSWMSNDALGNIRTLAIRRFTRTQLGLGHKPMNRLYTPHNHINDWHVATITS